MDPVDEALNEVVRALRAAIIVPGRDVVGARRNDWLRAGRFDAQDQSVCIVSFVGNLACAQNHAQRFAQDFDGEIQLGLQTAARARQRLRRYLFGAPEAW